MSTQEQITSNQERILAEYSEVIYHWRSTKALRKRVSPVAASCMRTSIRQIVKHFLDTGLWEEPPGKNAYTAPMYVKIVQDNYEYLLETICDGDITRLFGPVPHPAKRPQKKPVQMAKATYQTNPIQGFYKEVDNKLDLLKNATKEFALTPDQVTKALLKIAKDVQKLT